MAQNLIAMRRHSTDSTPPSQWPAIKQPDANMDYNFETTYKDDSTRSQRGTGYFTPMFTVEAYSYKATDLTVSEMATLLQIVAKGGYIDLYTFSPYFGTWRQDVFYVGRGSLVIGTLNESKERYDSISFNVIGVNPIP